MKLFNTWFLAGDGRRSALREGAVGGLVHQRGELRRVGQSHLEEPARAQRVAVGQARVVAQGFVDLGDLAR
jgi:hypothetical protein